MDCTERYRAGSTTPPARLRPRCMFSLVRCSIWNPRSAHVHAARRFSSRQTRRKTRNDVVKLFLGSAAIGCSELPFKLLIIRCYSDDAAPHQHHAPCCAESDSVSLEPCCPVRKPTPTARRSQGRQTVGAVQVRTGSQPETATHRGPKPGWVSQGQVVLRQVGPQEPPVPDADEGQRAFSWLLFSEPTF